MSLSRKTVLELMAYADGELDPEARNRIEALMAENAEARAILSAFTGSAAEAVGCWLRQSQEEHAVRAGAERVADAVRARLAGEPGSVRDEVARARMRTRVARIGLFAAATVVAALAAAVASIVHSGSLARVPASPEPHAAIRGESSAATPESQRPAADGVELDQVESPSHAVSIYYLPAVSASSVHASSVVIWIGEGNADRLGSGGD